MTGPDMQLREALNRLGRSEAKTVCVDVETSGLDWRKNAIVGYVLSFGPRVDDSLYVPFRHWGTANVEGRRGLLDPESWDGTVYPEERQLLDALDQPDKTVFGHNLSFDLKFMHRVGFKLRPHFEDTMINATLLNEWQERFSLQFCSEQAQVFTKKSQQIVDYLCAKFVEAKADPKSAMGHFWKLLGDDPMAVEYATGDGTSTWQLRDWQNKQIAEQSLERVHNVESRLIKVLARMTTHGIKIDEERLDFLLVDIQECIDKLLKKFPDGFNVKSPNAVKDWCLFHGRTDWPLTPTGKPSFPEVWLKTHEPGQQIVEVRKLLTLSTTFLGPMKETHLWNGRVHTNYHQLRADDYGTVTGRLSASDPNLQAASKHNKEIGKLHRSIFIPDRKIWANADYSQMEPRLLAYYTEAKVLVEGYHATPPIDAHTSVSMAVKKGEWERMTKEERSQYRNEFGKRINQTVITGGGRGVLVEKYGVPKGEVDQMLRDYHKVLPELRPFQKRAEHKMAARGYVMSLLGRRARLRDRSKAYTATNRLLQCGNADCIKLKMVEIDEYLESVGRPMEMINSIHDDLAFQFDEETRPVYDKCIEIMTAFGPEDAIPLSVPITVDQGEGKNWAEATFGEHK